MKRTALRRTPFRVSAEDLKIWTRKRTAPARMDPVTPLKRATRVRTVAARRGGVSRVVLKALDDVCKALCKLAAGAFRIDGGSQWIGPCRKCGKHTTLQWAHFIGRRCHRTRWEADNVDALCGGCHMAFDQKLSLITHEDWKVQQIGQERVDRLRQRLNAKFRIDYALTLIALKIEWKSRTGEDWT